ncbi:MAG: metal ABC transporter permease [Egibacteraceae bacterium]
MDLLYQLFVDPLVRYEFMRVGMMAAIVVGVTSSVLSCLLVVRHQALLGDAVSHAVLPGVAIGWLVAGHLGIFWGALIAALLSGVAITYVERHTRVKLDAVMGIVFTFAFALGLAIISVTRPTGIDLFHVLLGNVLGVDRGDLYLTAGCAALVLVTVMTLFRPLHLWSFDPVMAKAVGLPVGRLHYVLTVLLSTTIVASLQAVGLVLVVALLVTPGATAYLLSRRLSTMMLVASGAGLLAASGGLYGSYHLDVASGPAIVIVASLLFALAFCCAPRKGLISQTLRRRRSAATVRREDTLKALLADAEPVGPHGQRRSRVERRHVLSCERGLLRDGLCVRADDGLSLTERGRAAALQVLRAHRLLERYLHDAEGVPLDQVHAAADQLEHDVSADALEAMDASLGHPTNDPHGHPIPSPSGRLAQIAGHPLPGHPLGLPGRVAMVADDRADLLAEMVALGVVPDATVTLIADRGGQLETLIGERRTVLTRAVAERVFVVSQPCVVSVAEQSEQDEEQGKRAQEVRT